jgi:hypothetical protein
VTLLVPVRGARSRGMLFTTRALPDTPSTRAEQQDAAAAKPEPRRPCFVRDAANGASADHQALRALPTLPWAHCGTEADGKVGTLELELACLPSLRAPLPQASQGPPR